MYTCCTCLYLHTHLLLLLMYVVCIFSSVVCKFNMIIWWQTDRRTDGRNYYLLYQYRVSVLTRDKNWNVSCHMAEYCHNSWSKCPPSTRTHARRRPYIWHPCAPLVNYCIVNDGLVNAGNASIDDWFDSSYIFSDMYQGSPPPRIIYMKEISSWH